MLTDASCRFTPTPVQRSLVILDILFPAGFGVTQQMQYLHDRPPGE
jgi:hypothetical protein